MLYHSCLSVKRKKSLTDLWSYFCVSVRMIDGCVPAHTVMSSLSCDWEGRGGEGRGFTHCPEFQVSFNFHNKTGELKQRECPAKLKAGDFILFSHFSTKCPIR